VSNSSPFQRVNLANGSSFPFGWLFLPVDLIGRPFSQKTRDHFLPLLTSTQWWSQTQLALRRVFQMDNDFQERMFARQIAVMKGQAWNVVETLKTPDHGPLELTRRAKVCVWDDLVDVPVAVPMRVASAEMRRRATAEADSAVAAAAAGAQSKPTGDRLAEEEMDIGASTTHASSAPPTAGTGPVVADLLGLASPPADLPHPGRFELALQDEPTSPNPLGNGAPPGENTNASTNNSAGGGKQARPQYPRASRSLNVYSPDRGAPQPPEMDQYYQSRFSYTTTAAARRESNSIAAQLYHGSGSNSNGRASLEYGGFASMGGHHGGGEGGYDEEDEEELEGGDLGYAAATGMEGNRRKVIVERLEMVKGRNPVFTWC
jgi:hypothetical protein